LSRYELESATTLVEFSLVYYPKTTTRSTKSIYSKILYKNINRFYTNIKIFI